MNEPWSRHRALLQESLQRAAVDPRFSHADLMREQLQTAAPPGDDLAALLCLRAAEAAGGRAEAALPGATALALLAQMRRVFTSLESGNGAAGLSTAWGMPRALNTGDALFAAAQNSLLAASEELSVEQRLECLRTLDGTARTFLEALSASVSHEGPTCGLSALLSGALVLGGLLAGADSRTLARLREIGSVWASLTPAELERALDGDLATAIDKAG